MAVLWEVSSMLDRGLELMENVLIQKKFLSVQIIMEISSLTPMSFLEMGSTQEDRRTQRELDPAVTESETTMLFKEHHPRLPPQ